MAYGYGSGNGMNPGYRPTSKAKVGRQPGLVHGYPESMKASMKPGAGNAAAGRKLSGGTNRAQAAAQLNTASRTPMR